MIEFIWCNWKNKSYLNDIITVILQLGHQKACWSHQVERENTILPSLTSVERHNLIGYFFVKDFIGWLWEYRVKLPGTLWEYRVTWQCTADNLYTCAIMTDCFMNLIAVIHTIVQLTCYSKLTTSEGQIKGSVNAIYSRDVYYWKWKHIKFIKLVDKDFQSGLQQPAM